MQPQTKLAPRLEAILFAETGTIENGKANLTGLFDRVSTNADRFAFWVFVRVASLRLNSPVKVTVTAPNGQIVGNLTIATSAMYPSMSIQNLAPFNLPIIGEGVYTFDVTYDGRSLGIGQLNVLRLGN